MKKIYIDINQSVDSTLMQKTEITFESMSASFARRIDLRRRQLYTFAMRYYREISKKPSGKNLLTKPRAILDTTRLRELIDLVNRLRFESFEITALKQFSKSADSTIIRENEKLTLVTDDSEKIRKDKCEILHTQNYEEDRKFLFITHLLDNKYEQFEKITFYFKLKFIYLKFYKMSNDFNSQQNLTTTTEKLLSSTFRLTQSTYSSREDSTRGTEHMKIDEKQTDDTMMQNKEGEKQRTSF